MFCVSCGHLMEQRSEVHGQVVFYTHGCTQCDRAFHHSTPSKQTMDERFKLIESVVPWAELKSHCFAPLTRIMERRKKDAVQVRMGQRCVLRFCLWCGAPFERLRGRHQKGVPRYTYGCPKRGCGGVFRQLGKCYVRLEEVDKGWTRYKAWVRQAKKRRGKVRK